MDDNIQFKNTLFASEVKEEENSCKKFKQEDSSKKFKEEEDSSKKFKEEEDSSKKFKEEDSCKKFKVVEDSNVKFKEVEDSNVKFKEVDDSNVKFKEVEDSNVKFKEVEDSNVKFKESEDSDGNEKVKEKQDSGGKFKRKRGMDGNLEDKEDSCGGRGDDDNDNSEPNLSIKSNTSNPSGKIHTSDSSVKSNTSDSSIRSNTPDSSVKSNTSDSSIRSNTPDSSVKSNTSDSSIRSNTPDSSVKSNTSDSSIRSNTPDSSIKSNTSDSSIRSNTSDSSMRSNTSDSSMRSNTPDSSIRSNTPDSMISNTPDSMMGSNTPDSSIRSITPDSSITSNMPDFSIRSYTPDSGIRSNTPISVNVYNSSSNLLDHPTMQQTLTFLGSSDHLHDHYETLTHAFNHKYFKYVFEQLERNNITVFLNEKFTKFFIKELKNKRSFNVIRALHGIHSVISNSLSVPRIIASTLAYDNFLSWLFDPEYDYNSGSYSFLTTEILADSLSELFHKIPLKEESTFLNIFHDMCRKYFYVCMGPPSVYFHIITAYLAVGTEALPEQYYAPLKNYFNHMLMTVSRNKLSSHCISKIWDKLMLFCHHWVKYAFNYSHLHSLNLPCSKIKYKDRVSPDFSIFKSSCVRDKLKYEFIHVEDGYVPCEYPLVPSFPKLPKTFSPLDDPANCCQFFGNVQNLTQDFIGIGHCNECNRTDCSCVQDYIELEAREQMESSCVSAMELDEDQNVSLDGQNESSSSEVLLQVCFDPSEEDMSPEEIPCYYDYSFQYDISYSF